MKKTSMNQSRHSGENRNPRLSFWTPTFVRVTVLMMVAFLSLSNPAQAQKQDETAQKRALILQFFEAKPPRALVDASIEGVAGARYKKNDPAREEFVSRMQLAVDYDRIEEIATNAMMNIYSVAELQAMVDYYTSDVGRLAETKAADFRAKIAPELKKMLDQGMLNVVTTPTPAESAQGN